MEVKLKETAPWETLPLKQGITLNKKEYVNVAPKEVQEQIMTKLENLVEFKGEKPIRRRRLKVTGESTKEVVSTEKTKEVKPILETSTIIEKVKSKDTKGLVKNDLVRVLIELGFTKDELKGINKTRLIDTLEIELK